MNTFLWGVGGNSARVERLVSRALAGCRETMARLGLGRAQEADFHSEALRDSAAGGAGFVCRAPAFASACPVEVHVTKSTVGLVFGSLLDVPAGSVARQLVSDFEQGRLEEIRHREGSFGVAFVDRIGSQVTLASDVVGHRALRFWIHDGTFFVSPHDLCFAATGDLDLHLDVTSLASMITLQWSLGGASFIKGVQAAEADEVVHFDALGVKRTLFNPISMADRIEIDDHQAVDRHIKGMSAQLRESIRHQLSEEAEVQIALTSGMDSRSLLGPSLKALGAERVSAMTYAEDGSNDAEVARRLARIAGIPIEVMTPEPATVEQFDHNTEMAGILMNGDVCSERFTLRTDPREGLKVPKIGGQGGEVFRGVCYPNGPMPTDSVGCAEAIGSRRLLLGSASFADPAVGKAVERRLIDRFERYRRYVDEPADQLDLFYLLERVGRWGAEPGRLPWLRKLAQPYQAKRFLLSGLLLPPGIGIQELFHRELIRSDLPKAYWLEVNGTRLLPWRRFRSIDKLDQELRRLARGVRRRALGVPRKEQALHLAAIAAARIGCHLGEHGLRDRLERQGSVSRLLFLPEELRRWIDAHIARKARYELPLGSLLTLESYWNSLHAVAASARRMRERSAVTFRALAS